MQRQRVFNRDSYWSLLGGALPAATALICFPMMAYLYGADRFSYVSLLFSVFLFLIVYDFGLARSLHHFLPPLDRNKTTSQYINSGLLLGILVALSSMLLLYLFVDFFVGSWLSPPQEVKSELITAFKIVGTGLIPSVWISVFKGALEGKGEFRVANLAKILSGCSLFLMPLMAFPLSSSLITVSCSLVLSRLIALGLYIHFARRHLAWSLSQTHISKFSDIVKYSVFAAIAGFISAGFVFLDRFFVAGFISSTELSVYVLSQDIMSRYLLVPWSLAIVLVPTMARTDNLVEQLKLKTSWYRKVSMLNLLFVILLLLCTFLILPFLIPDSLDPLVFIVVAILSVGVVAGAYSQLPLVSLFAKGQVKQLMYIFVFESLIYFLTAPILFEKYGVIGASAVWSARLVLEAVIFKIVLNRCFRCQIA